MNNPEILLKKEQIEEMAKTLPESGPFGEEISRGVDDFIIVSRLITSDGIAERAEIHENYTDIFLVKEGEEEFYVGGEITDKAEISPGEWRGKVLGGARIHRIKAGDVLFVPKGVPHRHGAGKIKTIVAKIG